MQRCEACRRSTSNISATWVWKPRRRSRSSRTACCGGSSPATIMRQNKYLATSVQRRPRLPAGWPGRSARRKRRRPTASAYVCERRRMRSFRGLRATSRFIRQCGQSAPTCRRCLAATDWRSCKTGRSASTAPVRLRILWQSLLHGHERTGPADRSHPITCHRYTRLRKAALRKPVGCYPSRLPTKGRRCSGFGPSRSRRLSGRETPTRRSATIRVPC